MQLKWYVVIHLVSKDMFLFKRYWLEYMNYHNYSLIHVKGETNIIKQCISQKMKHKVAEKHVDKKQFPPP